MNYICNKIHEFLRYAMGEETHVETQPPQIPRFHYACFPIQGSENLHMTICAFGRVTSDELKLRIEDLETTFRNCQSFSMQIKGAEDFSASMRVLKIDLPDDIYGKAKGYHDRWEPNSADTKWFPFNPHVNITGYDENKCRLQVLSATIDKVDIFNAHGRASAREVKFEGN